MSSGVANIRFQAWFDEGTRLKVHVLGRDPGPTLRELIDADDDSDVVREANYSGPECSHCHTRTTSVWRRNKVGAQVCNACGCVVSSALMGEDVR